MLRGVRRERGCRFGAWSDSTVQRVCAHSFCAGASRAVCKIAILPTARSWRGFGLLRSWLLHFLDKRSCVRR